MQYKAQADDVAYWNAVIGLGFSALLSVSFVISTSSAAATMDGALDSF